MTTTALPGRRRDITRGLTAALVLLLVLAAVPLLLIHTGGGVPLRTGVPTLTELGHRLSAPDDGHLLLTVLLMLGWAGWLTFAAGVGVEIVALRRGRLAPSLPLGGMQQLAARLVTAVAMLLPAAHTPLLSISAAAATTITQQPPQASTISATTTVTAVTAVAPSTLDEAPNRPSPTQPVRQPAAKPVPKMYTVAQPHDGQRDTLWSIAARHLGDPLRWQQIFQLNQGRTQPGGQILTDPALIRPGWQLLMPADATDLPAPSAATASPPTPRLPAPQQQAPSADPASPFEVTVPAPVLAPPPSQEQHHTASPAPERKSHPSRVAGRPSAPAHEHDEPPVRAAAEIGGGLISLLLAAGFLRQLNTRRRLQRRRRIDGHTIPTPNRTLAATETKLRVAADHDLAAQLNSALRRMTLEQSASGASEVTYWIGRVTPAGLQLSANGSREPAPSDTGFCGEDSTTISLDTEPAPDAPALLPLLIPVGRSGDQTLMLDLERIADLALLGETDVVDQVLASMLYETLVAPWSDTTRITVLCNTRSTAPALLETAAAHPDRVTVLAVVTAQLLQSLEHETRALSRPRPTAPSDPVLITRTSTKDEPHPAHLVIAVDPLPAHELQQLQQLQARLPRPAFTLVHANPTTEPSATVQVTPGAARLSPDNLEFIPYRIAAQLAEDLHELLDLTEQPADVPAHVAGHAPAESEHNEFNGSAAPYVDGASTETTGDAPLVDAGDAFDPTLDVDLAAYHDTSRTGIVRVCLLGPPAVVAPGPLAPNRRATCTEIVTYLATHPRGVDITDLETAIWPQGVKASTRHQALARTRAWLGQNEQGEPNLPTTSGGQLRLAPTVLIDWELFTRLVRRADHRPKGRATDLRAALRLVQGKPFENLPSGRYGWLAENLLEQHIPSAIVDAAHHLAELLLEQGDNAGAQQIAQTALTVDQYDERTWRDLLRVAAAEGNLLGVAKLRDQLRELLGDDDEDDLAPETSELLNELLPRKRAVND